jgi:hypothetical protein
VVRTLATLVFIAGVGGGAVYLSQKKTVIKGSVIAADLQKQLESRGITQVDCDDAIADKKGAVILCRVAASDGSRATFEYTMNREGSISGKQLGESSYDRGPTAPAAPRTKDPSADPWTQ